jgi:hypothetical protein
MRYKRINISVSKEDLLKILQKILKTETNLDFLLELKKEDLERLVAIIRGRLEE